MLLEPNKFNHNAIFFYIITVKSYAEIVQSPPVLRTPLREMSNNTPLSDQNQG
jgi:capsular polysaccharide biosynthesis protein